MLIRSAFSANIKERRDCSTALFDERGRMIAQAEHIPVHLGAMPDAVAAVMRPTPRPARSGSSTTRTRAARTCPTSRSSRAPRSASPSRARTTPTSAAIEPASLPADSRDARRGGRRHPADASRRRGARAASSRNARNPDERRGDLRAQLAAHRLAEQRIDELCERRGRERRCRGDGRALRVLGARRARGARAPPRRSLRGRGRARGDRGRADDPRARSRSPATRSRSTSPARRRSTTGTSTARSRDALGLLLRRPLPHRARPARVRRRVRARDRDRARGLPRQRACARGGRRREHRDLVPDRRRRCSRRSAGVDVPRRARGR